VTLGCSTMPSILGVQDSSLTELCSVLQARQSSRDGGNILMSLLACVLE
jgi:hypothetical protein